MYVCISAKIDGQLIVGNVSCKALFNMADGWFDEDIINRINNVGLKFQMSKLYKKTKIHIFKVS